jgi:hypothetical protein
MTAKLTPTEILKHLTDTATIASIEALGQKPSPAFLQAVMAVMAARGKFRSPQEIIEVAQAAARFLVGQFGIPPSSGGTPLAAVRSQSHGGSGSAGSGQVALSPPARLSVVPKLS